jgi:hypothetical protein
VQKCILAYQQQCPEPKYLNVRCVSKCSIKSKFITVLYHATAAGPSSGDGHLKIIYLSVKDTAKGPQLRAVKIHASLADSRTAFGNFINELKKLKI